MKVTRMRREGAVAFPPRPSTPKPRITPPRCDGSGESVLGGYGDAAECGCGVEAEVAVSGGGVGDGEGFGVAGVGGFGGVCRGGGPGGGVVVEVCVAGAAGGGDRQVDGAGG